MTILEFFLSLILIAVIFIPLHIVSSSIAHERSKRDDRD